MKRVVIESPYAARGQGLTPKGVAEEIEGNVRYARRCVRDCLTRGESPYASHLFFTQPDVLDDTVPAERTQGIEAGFAWSETAHLVAVYIDRGVSDGMRKGVARAHAARQPVEVRTLDGVTITAEHLGLERKVCASCNAQIDFILDGVLQERCYTCTYDPLCRVKP